MPSASSNDMLLEKIPLQMTADAFAREFPQAKINGDKATFAETGAGGEVLYRLAFKDSRLHTLSLTINGEFTQSAYDDITAITKSITYMQKGRGFATSPQETKTLAWKELIESPLPDTGDRSIQVFTAGWHSAGTKAILNFYWTWPGQLNLEYREEPAA